MIKNIQKCNLNRRFARPKLGKLKWIAIDEICIGVYVWFGMSFVAEAIGIGLIAHLRRTVSLHTYDEKRIASGR